VAKLQIVTAPGKPAFLRVTQLEKTQALQNASSPIVTSNGARSAIVWVLDTNGKRSAPLYGPDAPLAVLYAFDATNLKLLWKSAPGQLATTGKYNEPTVLNGVAYVAPTGFRHSDCGADRSTFTRAPTSVSRPRLVSCRRRCQRPAANCLLNDAQRAMPILARMRRSRRVGAFVAEGCHRRAGARAHAAPGQRTDRQQIDASPPI